MHQSRRIFIASIALVCAQAGSDLPASPIAYQLPSEASEFDPGENLDVVQNNCTACHSSDHIKTQPRGPAFGKPFWRAEVLKMIKSYGAPIDDTDIEKVVEYLASTY